MSPRSPWLTSLNRPSAFCTKRPLSLGSFAESLPGPARCQALQCCFPVVPSRSWGPQPATPNFTTVLLMHGDLGPEQLADTEARLATQVSGHLPGGCGVPPGIGRYHAAAGLVHAHPSHSPFLPWPVETASGDCRTCEQRKTVQGSPSER